jgi:hypothetical protein
VFPTNVDFQKFHCGRKMNDNDKKKTTRWTRQLLTFVIQTMIIIIKENHEEKLKMKLE